MPLGDPMGGETPEHTKGKLLRISQVWIPVSDLDASIEIYTEVLGLRLASDHRQEGWVEVATVQDGGNLVLYLAKEGGEDQPGIKTGVVFSTDSIYDFHKTLVDEGIEFTLKPRKDRYGRLIARFTDDDGNEFEVVDAPKK
jgi:catechol 2,3-dioxygenase-like lactoylglutathione lyase family enzyme